MAGKLNGSEINGVDTYAYIQVVPSNNAVQITAHT